MFEVITQRDEAAIRRPAEAIFAAFPKILKTLSQRVLRSRILLAPRLRSLLVLALANRLCPPLGRVSGARAIRWRRGFAILRSALRGIRADGRADLGRGECEPAEVNPLWGYAPSLSVLVL